MPGRLLVALFLSVASLSAAHASAEACPPIPPTLSTAWSEGTWDVKQGDKDWFTVHITRAQFGVLVDILRYSDTSWRPLKVPAVCNGPRQTMVLVTSDTETAEELRITLGAAEGGVLVGTVAGSSLPAPVRVTATKHDLARGVP
ncbi:MAG: hypothetical protein Q8P41_03140 [Pseudomonadota bacterium]|nr:hypothetical protein [Pseudomonadota bacterium]